MVKKIVSIVVIALLVIRLITFPWSADLTDILNTASLVIISVAAGVALSNLLRGGAKDEA